MRLNRKRAVYGLVVCLSILLSGCAPRPEATVSDDQPSTCGDLLIYYNKLSAKTDVETAISGKTTLSAGAHSAICTKLRQAIVYSMPGSRQQNDKQALELLHDLELTDVLHSRDLQFKNMLILHVTQRQELRDLIAAHKERLAEVESQNIDLHEQLTTLQSQLDQLKSIETEIDKKERSLTSPTND